MQFVRRDLLRLRRLLEDELSAVHSCRVVLDRLTAESDDRDDIERAFEAHIIRAQILQRALVEGQNSANVSHRLAS
jgi:hypothetical protein